MVEVELERLLRRVGSPFDVPVWLELRDPLTFVAVEQALRAGVLSNPEVDGECVAGGPGWTPERHAARVAWFVQNGWTDPVVVSYRRTWPVVDGNHRLAAAIFRDDPTILVEWK